MQNIEVGVIGVGFFGELEVKALTEIAGVDVVAVADASAERAEAVAKRYDVPNYYQDFDPLLRQVDAAVIATPESEHKDPFLQALSESCPVLVEKPLADNLEDGQEMLSAAEKSDLFTTIGYELRFDGRYTQGKEELERVGEISSLHLTRRGWIDTPERVKDWTHLLFYSLVHDIDVLRWYTESEPKLLFAGSSSNVLGEGYDDCVNAVLQMSDGSSATVTGNWVMPSEVGIDPISRAEVFGKEGMIQVTSYDQGISTCISGAGYEFPDVNIWSEVNGTVRGALKRQFEHFIDQVRDGATSSPFAASIGDGYESLKIALAIKKSIRSGDEVSLE